MPWGGSQGLLPLSNSEAIMQSQSSCDPSRSKPHAPGLGLGGWGRGGHAEPAGVLEPQERQTLGLEPGRLGLNPVSTGGPLGHVGKSFWVPEQAHLTSRCDSTTTPHLAGPQVTAPLRGNCSVPCPAPRAGFPPQRSCCSPGGNQGCTPTPASHGRSRPRGECRCPGSPHGGPQLSGTRDKL